MSTDPSAFQQSKGLDVPVTGERALAGWLLGVLGIVLAIAFEIVPVRLSYGVSTIGGLAVLLGASATALWVFQRAFQWRRTGQRPRDFWFTLSAAVAALVLLFAVAQPTTQHLHRAECAFAPFGVGLGKVWVKVQPFPEHLHKQHQVHLVWGAYSAQIDETLDGPTYFVFNKRAIRSPSADITVEPPGMISCGRGSTSGDSHQVSVSGAVWQQRPSLR